MRTSRHAIRRRAIQRRTHISTKLGFAIVGVMLIVFGLYYATAYMDEVAAIDNRYRDKARTAIDAANIALEGRSTINTGNYLQALCERLSQSDSSIRNIAIYAVKKDVGMVAIADSDQKNIGRKVDNSYAISFSGKTKNLTTVFKDGAKLKDNRELEAVAPLLLRGKPIATIGVSVGLVSRDIAVREYTINSLLRWFAALALIMLLQYLVMRIEVFKPLWQLAADAHDIARGNFNRRSLVNRSDEIGELAREFNIMAMFLQQREEENQRLIKSVKDKWVKAEAKSQTDFLTKLENHRSFQDRLEAELERASRNRQPVSLLFCDLDKFKNFNDTNGHPLGDKALFDVAMIIKQSIRTYDIAARYGGEEFAIILPNAGVEEAISSANRIRDNVAAHMFTVESGLGNMTISIGVATYPDDAEAKELLITASDYAMYESKKLGGNAVTLFTSFGSPKPKKAS